MALTPPGLKCSQWPRPEQLEHDRAHTVGITVTASDRPDTSIAVVTLGVLRRHTGTTSTEVRGTARGADGEACHGHGGDFKFTSFLRKSFILKPITYHIVEVPGSMFEELCYKLRCRDEKGILPSKWLVSQLVVPANYSPGRHLG